MTDALKWIGITITSLYIGYCVMGLELGLRWLHDRANYCPHGKPTVDIKYRFSNVCADCLRL